MTTQHTPGEWFANGVHVSVHLEQPVDDCDDWCIVECAGAPGGREEAAANARLMAKAPKLLAACEEADRLLTAFLERILVPHERVMGRGDIIRAALAPLRAAVAEAKGEQP